MKKYLIYVFIFVAILIAYFFLLKQNEKMKVVDVVPVKSIDMCYQYLQQTLSGYSDRAWLKMNIQGENVSGEYQNLPAEKDSKVGKFIGTVGPMDPKISGRIADVWWDSTAEGMNVKEQLNIEFGEGSAVALFGEMVDRGDGVYVYKDMTKLTPGFQMSQVDCESFVKKIDISILVPENIDAYNKAMTNYLQEGGKNPLDKWLFVKKILSIPYTTDIIRASADAAAGELITQTKASVSYFKIQGDTAYVLLNIDLDGWAGVSVSIGRIHPLVEKTLLQFPQIKKVVFGFAPGDTQPN